MFNFSPITTGVSTYQEVGSSLNDGKKLLNKTGNISLIDICSLYEKMLLEKQRKICHDFSDSPMMWCVVQVRSLTFIILRGSLYRIVTVAPSGRTSIVGYWRTYECLLVRQMDVLLELSRRIIHTSVRRWQVSQRVFLANLWKTFNVCTIGESVILCRRGQKRNLTIVFDV